MMKKILVLLIVGTLYNLQSLTAQVRLDVEGDVKIRGKIDFRLNEFDYSMFMGSNAGSADDGFNNNMFFGSQSGRFNTSGQQNTFFGRATGASNTTGDNNAFFGHNTGQLNTTGFANNFVGKGSGFRNTTGFNNTYFGIFAGHDHNNTRTTLLGSNADTADSLNLAIAIGHGAKVGCHNCAVIGGTGSNAVNVGISTTTPQTKLHIEGGEDASFTKHGYLVNGPISGVNLAIDNNEILARNNGGPSDLFINAASGNVAIGLTIDPTAKLDINGTVRIRNVPSGSGDFVRIDADGNLFRSSSASRVVSDENTQVLIQEQKALIQAKGREIGQLQTENDIQNETIEDLKAQVTELKTLVEKLLSDKSETPKNTTLRLHLEPKALLAQNQPNPFRENTLVHYVVPTHVQNAHIQVTAFDGKVLGKVEIPNSGKGQVTIQSKHYPAGTYFYSLVLDGQVMETKRMVLKR